MVSCTRKLCRDPSVFLAVVQFGWKEGRKTTKTFERGPSLLPKKVPKCSVDADYKEGPRNAEMLARWQCEKVGQVIDSANAERENKKKMLRKQRGV